MTGYRSDFLDGINLPLPTFSRDLNAEILKDQPGLRDGMIADYIHYSLVMNGHEDKRSAAFVALNIDRTKYKRTRRGDDWRIDPEIGGQFQLNNDYYRSNPWDRGHMARRTTTAWGDTVREAQNADDETFYYSNSCLQHANLNQDEWLALEDWVADLALAADGKITSFSGPFYGDFDRTIRPGGRPVALVPAGFFKVVCFRNKDTNELDVRAFVMYQDTEALRDKRGKNSFNDVTYQTSVAQVERLTGLRFDDAVYEKNPMFDTTDNAPDDANVGDTPEHNEVTRPGDIIHAGDTRQTIHDEIVDIFIAMAMVDPAGADRNNEWVSLLNMGGEDVDVSDWELEDNSGKRVNISAVITDANARTMKPGHALVIKPLGPLRLSNKRDVIRLYDKDGARIDFVDYTKRLVKTGKPVHFLSPRDTLT